MILSKQWCTRTSILEQTSASMPFSHLRGVNVMARFFRKLLFGVFFFESPCSGVWIFDSLPYDLSSWLTNTNPLSWPYTSIYSKR